MKKNKILLSAYACEPGKGSEPGVGWNWVRQIARYNEVWVITRENNKPLIESDASISGLPIHWIYYDLPPKLRSWKKGNKGVYLYYFLWQIGAYRKAKKLHQEVQFDLAHHITFGTFWLNSFMSLLPVKFIWGPLGGGDVTPKALTKTISENGVAEERKRNIMLKCIKWDPFLRLSYKKANIVLSNTKATSQEIKKLGGKSPVLFSHMGIDLTDFPLRENKSSLDDIVFISVGRLIHWKGYHLSIESFARFFKGFPNSEYWVIGDGPEKKTLESLAGKLGVSNQIKFFGNIDRRDVLEKLYRADVFVHPAFHDSAPSACIEAMAAKLPVICLDIAGPGLQISNEAGFKISLENAEKTCKKMSEAMRALAESSELRKKMGAAGRKRAEEMYCWDKKGDYMQDLYSNLVEQH